MSLRPLDRSMVAKLCIFLLNKALHRRKKKKSPITIKKKKTIAITIKNKKSGDIKSKISIYWQVLKSKKIVVVSRLGKNSIKSEREDVQKTN